jgi:hypothetical protein
MDTSLIPPQYKPLVAPGVLEPVAAPTFNPTMPPAATVNNFQDLLLLLQLFLVFLGTAVGLGSAVWCKRDVAVIAATVKEETVKEDPVVKQLQSEIGVLRDEIDLLHMRLKEADDTSTMLAKKIPCPGKILQILPEEFCEVFKKYVSPNMTFTINMKYQILPEHHTLSFDEIKKLPMWGSYGGTYHKVDKGCVEHIWQTIPAGFKAVLASATLNNGTVIDCREDFQSFFDE